MCMSVCVQLLYPLLIHFNKTGCSGVRLRSSGESQIPWRVVVSRPKRPVSIGVWSGLLSMRASRAAMVSSISLLTIVKSK
jgi:hypothetical protein